MARRSAKTLRILTAAVALAATGAGAGAYLLRDSARVIDGDTIQLDRVSVRIWGIEAPDRPAAMKAAAGEYLAQQIEREGGVTCATRPSDNRAMRRARAPDCPSALTSYRRVVTACRFKRSGDDVGARMVAAGFAVDWRRFSDGYYSGGAVRARYDRAGLWRSNPVQMHNLAQQRDAICRVPIYVEPHPGLIPGPAR